jgi:hypothetical protein
MLTPNQMHVRPNIKFKTSKTKKTVAILGLLLYNFMYF